MESTAPSPEATAPQSDPADPSAQEPESQPASSAPVPDDPQPDRKHDELEPFDFRRPALLSPAELRKVRRRVEAFLHAASARLSIYLRTDFGLQLSSLQTLSFRRFADGLSNPAYLSLFKIEPLRGISILDLPPRLGLAMVDRLLGGPGQAPDAGRDIGEIESALLDQVVQLILLEWCAHWSGGNTELRPALVAHENNPRFLQTSSAETPMLRLALEARMGDCVEPIQIGMPCQTLEPLVTQLQSDLDPGRQTSPPPVQPHWNPELDEVQIPLVAGWDGLELTARELARLKPGDILQLSPQSTEHVTIRLAQLPKFSGRLGTRAGMWAVEVSQVLKPR